MHELKEEFTQIFDESKNLGEGTFKLIEGLRESGSTRNIMLDQQES